MPIAKFALLLLDAGEAPAEARPACISASVRGTVAIGASVERTVLLSASAAPSVRITATVEGC